MSETVKITLKDVASYNKNGTTLETDKKINLIYGLNGAGKTVLSNNLKNKDDSKFKDCSMEGLENSKILVYNQEFIQENCYEKEELNGIFTIAKENKDAEETIKKANTEKEEISYHIENELLVSENKHWYDKSFEFSNATINLATMFSGIGAVEFALKRLGLNTNIVFASDNDKFVKESYFSNYKINNENWYDDVIKIKGKKYLNKVDLLVGGSPCQSFSMIGKRKGFDDIRGTLFYEFARVIKESQPKVFIYENVKGLLNHDKGNTFATIKATFDELGYKYFYKLLNSKDYGMAQHRERIFVIGFKDKSVNFEFPEVIPLKHKMQDFLEDYIDSKYYLKEKGVKFVTSSKNRKKRYTQINGDIAICQKANQQFNWHGDFIFDKNFLVA